MSEDPGATSGGATIILADDDPVLREILRELLTKSGYIVHQAKTGAEAAFLFTSRPSDLLVTDLLMPDMDGVQLIRKLYEWGQPVRLLAITGGGGTADYLEAAKGLGALRTLRKPFSNADFLATVETCLAAPALPLKETWPDGLD